MDGQFVPRKNLRADSRVSDIITFRHAAKIQAARNDDGGACCRGALELVWSDVTRPSVETARLRSSLAPRTCRPRETANRHAVAETGVFPIIPSQYVELNS